MSLLVIMVLSTWTATLGVWLQIGAGTEHRQNNCGVRTETPTRLDSAMKVEPQGGGFARTGLPLATNVLMGTQHDRCV